MNVNAKDRAELARAIQREAVPTAAKPGRNDPCPCGSGLKYKKCCANVPLGEDRASRALGVACAQCGHPATGTFSCQLCESGKEKRYGFCSSHEGIVRISIEGHASRVHPEKFPGYMKCIAESPELLTNLRNHARVSPHLWSRQLAEVEKYIPKN